MPTILDALDFPVPKGVEGSSLLDLVFRENSGRPEEANCERGESVSIRTPGWKMIVSKGGTNELSDLEKDGAETQSLSPAQSPAASELLIKVGEYEKKASGKESKKKKEMTKEAKENLRSLGYIYPIGERHMPPRMESIPRRRREVVRQPRGLGREEC